MSFSQCCQGSTCYPMQSDSFWYTTRFLKVLLLLHCISLQCLWIMCQQFWLWQPGLFESLKLSLHCLEKAVVIKMNLYLLNAVTFIWQRKLCPRKHSVAVWFLLNGTFPRKRSQAFKSLFVDVMFVDVMQNSYSSFRHHEHRNCAQIMYVQIMYSEGN